MPAKMLQSHLHPAGTSMVSDKRDSIQSFWHVFTIVNSEKLVFLSTVFERNQEICEENNILRQIIIEYADPNYVATFQHNLKMAVI